MQGTAPASRRDGPPQEPDSAPQRQAPPWVCLALFAGPAQGPVEAWEAWRTRLPAWPGPGCGPLGARVAGRAAQWIPSLGPESRPPSPGAGFSLAPEKPTDTCVSDPPETGNSRRGWGGWLLTPQETQKAGPCLATVTPRLQAPLGATQPGSLSVSTPLCHLRREGRAGRSRGPDAQSSSWPGANETKSTETATNQSPSACDSEASPHLSAWGSFPGASLRFLSFRKNSRPQHSQDSRQGAQVPQQHHENQRPGG